MRPLRDRFGTSLRRVPQAAFLLASVLLLGATASACDVGIEYVDPPTIVSSTNSSEPVGEPALALGLYVEQLYDPLAEGEDLPIINGLQGGTWVMPAVRATGVETQVDIQCTVVTDTGERVGFAETTTRLYLAPDGWLERQGFPVRVNHPAPNEADPIDDLFGVPATLRCSIKDSGDREAEATVEIVLVEG